MKTTRATTTPAVPTTPKAAEVNKPAAPTASGATAPTTATSSTFNTANAARGADIEGSSHGYVSPTQVPSPFTNEEKVQLAKKIPCPALAGMFKAGMLKVEKDGTVKIPDLERALSQLGPDAITRKVLENGADKSDDVKDGKFNLFKLNGSNLDHTGSSGIRQNGTHPERFDKLMTFSKDGERLTAKDSRERRRVIRKGRPGSARSRDADGGDDHRDEGLRPHRRQRRALLHEGRREAAVPRGQHSLELVASGGAEQGRSG
ncbi:MAG: hypothetical protein QM817_08705 [Archangium sp.]